MVTYRVRNGYNQIGEFSYDNLADATKAVVIDVEKKKGEYKDLKLKLIDRLEGENSIVYYYQWNTLYNEVYVIEIHEGL